MNEPKTVIGFSGRPVQAATGWKPRIVYEAQNDRAYLEGTPTEAWSFDEVRRFEQERVLSLFPRPMSYRPGEKLVYAHELFMRPMAKGAPIPASGTLDYAPHLESYFAMLSEEAALQLYRAWSDQFLRFGRKALLAGKPAELALATAMRARYCTTLGPLRALRLQAFALSYAATAVLDRALEPLVEDAKQDFSDEEVDLIEQQGTNLVAERGEREDQRAAIQAPFLASDHDLATIRAGSPRSEASMP